MTDAVLDRLVRRARTRLGLLCLAAAPLVWVAAVMSQTPWLRISLVALVVASTAAWYETWRSRLDARAVARHLDRRYRQLQDSSELLLDSALSPAQTIQAHRVRRVLQALEPQIGAPTGPAITRSGARLWVILATGLLLALVVGPALESGLLQQSVSPEGVSAAAGQVAPKLVSVRVQPPRYTGIDAFNDQGLDPTVPEGSQVTWHLEVPASVTAVHWESDRDQAIAAVATTGDSAQVSLQVNSDQIYRFGWEIAGDRRYGEYRHLRVVRDLPPRITVAAPATSPLEIEPGQRPVTALEISASDDYALGDAHILATVASGDGENVRFREARFEFETAQGISTQRQYLRSWFLPELGMNPGDELYLQAVVSDRREPTPNRAATAVLMLRWVSDEITPTLAIDGIAVDLLPEYFRSQRQIIIDTERLLADQQTVSAAEGYRRSHNLALDQKALRLRYGQYLGEEYSSDIGASAPQPAALSGEHAEESFAEHLAHEDAGHEHGEAGPVSATIQSLPDFMADFVHVHDTAEQATLFDEQTRQTLTEALSAMWQAELALHLRRPADALPHEYRALDLIKQVQQANRIYVRRAGFEPPPLDEGKRLSGERDDPGPPPMQYPVESTDDPWQRAWADFSRGQLPDRETADLLLESLAQEQVASLRLLLAQAETCVACRARLESRLRELAPEPPARASAPPDAPHRRAAARYRSLLDQPL